MTYWRPERDPRMRAAGDGKDWAHMRVRTRAARGLGKWVSIWTAPIWPKLYETNVCACVYTSRPDAEETSVMCLNVLLKNKKRQDHELWERLVIHFIQKF